jgi:hypothetical protein
MRREAAPDPLAPAPETAYIRFIMHSAGRSTSSLLASLLLAGLLLRARAR